MNRRLPMAVEVSVGELRVSTSQLATHYELQVQASLSEIGESISCRKGCNHCCYHPVLVTILEGLQIYQWLSEQQMWTHDLKISLSEHSDKTLGLSLEVWLLSRISCPLLTDKGLCRTHAVRPLACQITYSVGDPEDCEPHKLAANQGMISKRALLEAIVPVETGLLRQHKLPHVRVPLSTALLYAEKIAKEELDIEDFHRALEKDIDALKG